MNNALAEIALDPKAKKIMKIDCHENKASFACQRCAIFCCKLGPPELSHQDIEQLKFAGRNLSTFLDENRVNLRTKEDGSCIFLSSDSLGSMHRCDIYGLRPMLCRLYPFQFQKLNEEKYELGLIACCKGLNTDDGIPVDSSFVGRLVKLELPRLIDSGLI